MGENFMTAITQIGDLLRKRDQIIDKTAGYISDAVVDRMRNGKLAKSTEKDIRSAIEGFSKEEQVDILTSAIVYVGMNAGGGSSRATDDYDDDRDYTPRRPPRNRGDIFRGR